MLSHFNSLINYVHQAGKCSDNYIYKKPGSNLGSSIGYP